MSTLKNLLLILIIFASLAAGAQGTNTGQPVESKQKHDMARLIVTVVLLKDTTAVNDSKKHKNAASSNNMYNQTTYTFLDPSLFSEFRTNIFKIANTSDAMVFYSSYGLRNRLSSKDIKEQFYSCISNPNANQADENTFLLCDSTSRLESVAAIKFYETWYFNTSTKMIEKEVLGYEPLYSPVNDQTGERLPFRTLFIVVKNEEARKRLIALGFNN